MEERPWSSALTSKSFKVLMQSFSKWPFAVLSTTVKLIVLCSGDGGGGSKKGSRRNHGQTFPSRFSLFAHTLLSGRPEALRTTLNAMQPLSSALTRLPVISANGKREREEGKKRLGMQFQVWPSGSGQGRDFHRVDRFHASRKVIHSLN